MASWPPPPTCGAPSGRACRPRRGPPRDEHDRLAPAEPRHLRGLDEVALDGLGARGAGALLSSRLAGPAGGDGLLAHGLRDSAVGVPGLAAQEERRVAAVDDGVGVVAVPRLELRQGLQDDRDSYVARPHDGDGPLEVGEAPHVGELVEDEVHGHGQAPAVLAQRPLAEEVRRLPEEQRKHEGVGAVGVRRRAEEGGPPALLAQEVKAQVVRGERLPELGRVEGREARVARDDDALEGLAGRGLEGVVAPEREVGIGRERLRAGHPARPCRRHGSAAAPAGDPRDATGAAAELLEEEVERALEALVGLRRLREREERHEPGERPVLLGAVPHEVADERRVEEPLGALPEGVGRRGAVPVGVLYEAVHDLQDVLLGADVGERVVAHGAREVHGVDAQDLVALRLEGGADLVGEGALGSVTT